MASQGYRDWLRAGRPYTLAPWLQAFLAPIRADGIIVYHYPNEEHQVANTPQDHTPFSATGWPIAHVRWFGNAIDIMPRGNSFAARKENADIARQIIADKDRGHPGTQAIKYINWTNENGTCRQVSWRDRRRDVPSTDRGHIHISGRSDFITRGDVPRYDVIARLRGTDMALEPTDPSYQDLVFRVAALVQGTDVRGGPAAGEINQVAAALRRIETKLDAGLQLTLSPEQLDQVADGVAARLAGQFPSLEDIRSVVSTEVRNALAEAGMGGPA